MTLETEIQRADLRALMASPQLGVAEYCVDPIVQRRVGRMLVEASRSGQAARAERAAPPAV